MSKEMGPLTFGKREESIFLGKEFARHQDYSEATAVRIDDEIRRFVNAAYKDSRSILEDNRESLEAITSALLEDEVLEGDEIYELIAKHSDIDINQIKKAEKAPAEADAAEVAEPA
jgi:cell division protease FtsH